MDTPHSAPAAQQPPKPSLRQLVDQRWVIVGLLFLVTGALGIPLLWMSRAFSRATKIWLSLVVTLYTGLLLWLTWLVVVWCWTRIIDVW